MLKWVYIFWPSFATAIIGEAVFFAFINPQELYLMGKPVYWSPLAIYSTGFLMFWGLTALTTWAMLFFLRPADEINRPIESRPGAARERPQS